MQSAKAAKDASRSREGWRLGNALLSAERLDEAEDLFQASPRLCLERRLICHGTGTLLGIPSQLGVGHCRHQSLASRLQMILQGEFILN